jgi:hypothetical protein
MGSLGDAFMPLRWLFQGPHRAVKGLDAEEEGWNGAGAWLNRTEEGLNGIVEG